MHDPTIRFQCVNLCAVTDTKLKLSLEVTIEKMIKSGEIV